MSTESPKTYFFWSGNALPDPPCYDQYTDDDKDDDDGVDVNFDYDLKLQAWARHCVVIWHNHCPGRYFYYLFFVFLFFYLGISVL